jgi:hypothetical protein
MMQALSLRLADLAAGGKTITYGQLARDLGLTGPATIARLTAALEATMEEDAAQNHPFRAVVVSGRLAKDLPAQGFFDKAASLGRFQAQDPTDYVATERAALQAFILAQISHGGVGV